MKKTITAIISSLLLLTGCGVGSYTVSSGRADEGAISFTSDKSSKLTVTIDGTTYKVCSVKEKAYKSDRNIKETARNTIRVTPGTHEVSVEAGGRQIYSQKLYISASEHKVVGL